MIKKTVKYNFIIICLFTVCIFSSCRFENEILKVDEKAYLSIMNNMQRTIAPSDFGENDITKAVLVSKISGETSDETVIGTWLSSETSTALSKLRNDLSISVDVGTYDFTLNLYAGSETYVLVETGSILNKAVSSGTNTLAFEMEYVSGFGKLSLTLKWTESDGVDSVKAGLFSIDGATAISNCDFESLEPAVNSYFVLYRKDNLPTGIYMIKFELYKNSTLLNTFIDFVEIGVQRTTMETKEFQNVNTLYTIDYQLNGGSFSEEYTPITEHNANTGVLLPTSSQLTLAGNQFGGWYEDSEFAGTAITILDATKYTSAITLYAKWTAITAPGNEDTDIMINGVVYDKTTEIAVITDETVTIIGTDDNWSSYLDETPAEWCRGVFIKSRTVQLSPFILGQYEVTQELYEAVLSDDEEANEIPSLFSTDPYGSEKQKLRPVEQVSWFDAVYFCNKLTKKVYGEATTECVYTITVNERDATTRSIQSATVTQNLNKKGYRLPTEAEWEFAARGGDTSMDEWKYAFAGVQITDGKKIKEPFGEGDFPTDENLATVGWYSGNSGNSDGTDKKTHQVGLKLPNALGLHDMIGNVWEWCWDGYLKEVKNSDLAGDTVLNPVGNPPSISPGPVFRGGSWADDADKCPVSLRPSMPQEYSDPNGGFRICRTR